MHIFYRNLNSNGVLSMSAVLKYAVFTVLSLAAVYIIFRPVLFPRCGCCGRVKFRTYFRYYAPVNMRLTRKGDLCLCRDCCLRYNIRSISDFKKRSEVKKRMEYKSKYL